MLRLAKYVLFAGAVLGLAAFSPSLTAQRKAAPVNLSSAPVPAPILQGKKAFISFELGDVSSFPSTYSGGPERAYNEFFQGMQAWGRYELVADPKEADVIFAIRFVDPPGLDDPQIRVGVTDARGRVSLWGFAEEINGAIRKKSRDAAFSAAIDQVINDVKLLVQPNDAHP
ncbi:hypothetical protein [Granulicella mallensis]|uniref:DUF4136 domain-containing protein n=1 Tax=Granulicella mallensis (strain ATCC BAA-1857 / DSM 23137 / MP5ACTX8) TaxID=682795 RepID=G8NXI8_GRAMM|nr:hypothetical protein [Granulicella mallensis]AEU38983.1 hypothetical protein AciX8_4714 [Granulicella mallensis MP5ACTX8]